MPAFALQYSFHHVMPVEVASENKAYNQMFKTRDILYGLPDALETALDSPFPTPFLYSAPRLPALTSMV